MSHVYQNIERKCLHIAAVKKHFIDFLWWKSKQKWEILNQSITCNLSHISEFNDDKLQTLKCYKLIICGYYLSQAVASLLRSFHNWSGHLNNCEGRLYTRRVKNPRSSYCSALNLPNKGTQFMAPQSQNSYRLLTLCRTCISMTSLLEKSNAQA